jgi:4-hydroxybenzoate polyprenyltransferase
MNSRTSILLLVVTALVCYLCFAQTQLVIRGICFLVSIALAIMAYCYFEHAVLFRDKWQAATSGKRRTPPGQSVIAGSIFLLLAIASMVFCFHH